MSEIIIEKRKEKIPFIEIKMKKEYDMSPTGPEHYWLCRAITKFLEELVLSTDYAIMSDVYRYLTENTLNLFGDFKHGVAHKKFIENLQRFGASKNFIKQKIQEYAGTGVAQGTYAPDVFVLHKDEVFNRFSIPLMIFEVISYNKKENDLYFKPYFYETIGVQEYYICQSTRTRGTVIKAYHLVMERYEEMRLEKQGYFSEVLLNYIPQVWQF